jgi:hypothetical protein
MTVALALAGGLWIFYLGMSKWSALRTSAEEPWWLLVWGNLMRIGALFCLIGVIYVLGSAIVGCQ